ncbi:hypothetical protein SAMN04487936_11436 [Halobacillus dabanensis]|uniref:Uncharacterized protein n=2 Tax=Halobacillus dabanensis TaxID=240302 RepID=A0A1I3ZLR0_HALDA|nr:hypothetical protein SAMN04487936_11436 [Halobacillus dabanensis]
MGWVNIMNSEELIKMTEERNMHHQGHMNPSYNQCNKMKNYHVMVQTKDGRTFDGIITEVDHNNMTILVSEDVMVDENGNNSEDRQYGYGRRRARRFRREVFPLAGLASLALFPYFARPYPYYPPYAYPYPYPYYY